MDWKKLIEFSTSSTPAPASQMYNFMPVPAFRSPKPHQNSKDQEARDPRFMQLVKQNMQVFWNDRMYEIYNATEYRRQHQLPLARIKKIMKLDEAVKMISADTPVLLAKACEIFILELTLRSWLHTEQNNYRTLQRCDIAKAISNEELLDFLTTVVPLDPQEEVTGSDLEENEPHPDNQIHLPMLNLNALGGTSHAPYYGIPGNPSAVHDSTINFLAEYKPGSK